jgi:hypothetical protein
LVRERGFVPLTFVSAGKQMRLVSKGAWVGLTGSLEALGLIRGAEFEVLPNPIHASFLVAVRGRRIMFGLGKVRRKRGLFFGLIFRID